MIGKNEKQENDQYCFAPLSLGLGHVQDPGLKGLEGQSAGGGGGGVEGKVFFPGKKRDVWKMSFLAFWSGCVKVNTIEQGQPFCNH